VWITFGGSETFLRRFGAGEGKRRRNTGRVDYRKGIILVYPELANRGNGGTRLSGWLERRQ